MQLYCKTIAATLVVLAVHADGDALAPSIYGEGVVVLPYAGPRGVADLIGQPAPEIDLMAYAEAKRYAVENGGVAIDGVLFKTDDRAKTLLLGARAAAQSDPSYTTTWYAADGSEHEVAAADIIAISNAVLAHVNRVFGAFKAVKTALLASPPTITTLSQVDAAFA